MNSEAPRTLRIATWNLRRPRSGNGKRARLLKERIRRVDADVWILTETHREISPGSDYHHVATDPLGEYSSPGESRTAIWSRLPVKKRVQTSDTETAICLEIEAPLGPMLIYGTVLPYHGAGTKYAYRSQGRDQSGKKVWQLHYESIAEHDAEWRRLREQHPEHHLCIGGDLNQSRDGRLWGYGKRQWYGTQKGRKQLGMALQVSGIRCLTEEDFVEAGKLQTKSSVDHLCFTDDLAKQAIRINAWEADVLDDTASKVKRVSDHNGIYVDF